MEQVVRSIHSLRKLNVSASNISQFHYFYLRIVNMFLNKLIQWALIKRFNYRSRWHSDGLHILLFANTLPATIIDGRQHGKRKKSFSVASTLTQLHIVSLIKQRAERVIKQRVGCGSGLVLTSYCGRDGHVSVLALHFLGILY